jgi:hypothetical protein
MIAVAKRDLRPSPVAARFSLIKIPPPNKTLFFDRLPRDGAARRCLNENENTHSVVLVKQGRERPPLLACN